MKIRRTELLKAIQRERERRTEDLRRLDEKALRDYEDKKREYVEERSDAWRDFVTDVIALLEAKEPIPSSLVPAGLHDRYDKILFWDSKPPRTGDAPYTADLDTLEALLGSVVDEEVSTAELQRLGFKVPQVFRSSV